MIREDYIEWLREAVPSKRTFDTKLSELRRVAAEYGDLDEMYDSDEMASLIEDFTYSTADAASGRENPSKFNIDGDIRNSLASYKSAIMKYVRFRQTGELEAHERQSDESDNLATAPATFGLEKDMQIALRTEIGQLERGLTIIDGGVEKHVNSGFIDILAEDHSGTPVVIELKAVKAPLKAISQIMSYMGDIDEETGKTVRGILVAPDFDRRLVSAARVTPSIALIRYSFSFAFSEVEREGKTQ